MDRPLAWVINLDAEDELARPLGYAPPRAVAERIAVIAPRLAPLLGDDVVLAQGATASGHEARAWCPTPRAMRIAERAGCVIPPVPSLAVLQRVNSRAFCASLGQSLPAAVFATTRAMVDEAIARAVPTGSDNWLLKRVFGYAGRGRRRVRPGVVSHHDAPWIDAALREGGLQIEPWVECLAEFALHGFLERDTEQVTFGEITTQRIDAYGAWLASVLARDEIAADEVQSLRNAANESAFALRRAGYFGAFGIDAYRWRDARGEVHFQARSEINARYSMGWAVGMNGRRPDRTSSSR